MESSQIDVEAQARATRQRNLTERGREYQLETKVKCFGSKRSELCKQIKATLMLRGQCDDVSKWKQELSKAQVIQMDLADIHCSIGQLTRGEVLHEINDLWSQVTSEWNNFQEDVKNEIRYVEQLHIERAKSVCGSKASVSSRKSSRCGSRASSHTNKLRLQQKEAALKVELAFLTEGQNLERQKLRQEQDEENFRLKKELAQHQAQLNVCNELDSGSVDAILSNLPKESHTESVMRYFDSLAPDTRETAPPLVESGYFLAPTFSNKLSREETKTVQINTPLHTTITTATPLISPAHYAVSNANLDPARQQDNCVLIDHSFSTSAVPNIQPPFSVNTCVAMSSPVASDASARPVITVIPDDTKYQPAFVNSGQRVVMSTVTQSVPQVSKSAQVTKPCTTQPMQHSTPLYAQRAAPATSEVTSPYTISFPVLSPIIPTGTASKTHSSPLSPSTELRSATSMRKQSANSAEEQHTAQVSATAGLEKVATSLEHCVTKLIESSERIALTNVSQGKDSKPSSNVFRLPAVKIPVFSGDPLEYPVWNSAFKALVDTKVMDADTKLNLLNQYVSGSPKQVVEHYLLIGTEDAYVKAKSVLQERYGNPNVVSSAFLSKLEKWPKISPRDSGSLREFSDFLDKVVVARQHIPSLAILDFAKENVKLIAKLPYQVESTWRDEITTFRNKNGEASFPPFTKFADFVRNAADKANIPELDELSKLNNNPRAVRSTGARALATVASDKQHHRSESSASSKEQIIQTTKLEKNRKNNPTKEANPVLCAFCNEEHSLISCKAFQEKPFSVRKNFFFRKRLCLGCAQGNHQIKDCKDKLICEHCGEGHLTCLHQIEKANNNCISVCGSQGGSIDNSMIVPVWVRQVGNPTEILQYAVLDDQSNVSFISQRLCDRLHLKGHATRLNLTTMQESNAIIDTSKISDVEVLDYKKKCVIKLPMLYTREKMPADSSQIATPEVARQWKHLQRIADELIPYQAEAEVSILIGSNCTRAIRPREICCGGEDDPYAQKTLLGWGIIGRVCKSNSQEEASTKRSQYVAATQVKEVLASDVLKALEADFQESSQRSRPLSIEDRRFLQLLEDGITKLDNGHYQMPLPLKTDNISLPNNRPLAEKRWRQLQSRFKKNPKFLEDYKLFMKDVVKSCAERVPSDRLDVTNGKINYVPHTGVYHPRKPGSIRVVFDCSARFDGVSLNDCLLPGPDLTNGLLGVLCRFREERTAFMMDVKGMFHQFFVSEHHRDLLRFLWWEDNDESKDVIEYRMKVHLFGATSSPGCANFGLKRAADDGEKDYGTDAANFIRENFYVDDGLKSTATASEAINLIKSSKAICANAGLHLHKITSNSKEVLRAVPPEDRSKNAKEIDLMSDPLPIERALGVIWCVEDDSFQFRIELKDRPFTRRGVLSTVSSIYDPIGFVAPVTLKGKQILQQMCRDKLEWDSPVPDSLRPLWEKWRIEITELEKLKVSRSFKSENSCSIKAVELHSFSDASQEGYGQCSYLRIVDQENHAHCSFVAGKARVTPLKTSTIPRLELAAATTSARMSKFLRAELTYQDLVEYYHTDSQVVLGYITNESRRFHVYVANRVQQIREITDPNAWMYVDTSENPADDASRGLTARQLLGDSRWLRGPEFLWKDGAFKNELQAEHPLDEADPEVKKGVVLSSKAYDVQAHLDVSRLAHISSWFKLKRAIALCLQWMAKLKDQVTKKEIESRPPAKEPTLLMTPSILQRAERVIIRCVQAQFFAEELQTLRSLGANSETEDSTQRKKREMLKKTSSIRKLDPYIDQEGLIRVGGRIGSAKVPDEVCHPVLLPRKSHVTTLLIRHYHVKVNHMGRTTTHNELRQRGYWILGGSAAVSNVITECVACRRQRRPLEQQKMSSLPKDRLDQVLPFSYCAVDYFGPYLIKERRSEVKRYGALFTCLASRGVHIETSNSLDTSSFICALRRFLARRGPVQQIRCDQGTNFVGAHNELKAALKEMDQDRVSEYLLSEHDCEWIPFKFNTPHSSHMGGSWERLIGTVRRALEPVLRNHGKQLDDESLRTFMTEVECIVNSRPLTTDNLCAADAPEPLTPSHLLMFKPKLLLPPPGEFQHADVYSRHRWRRVQYLINQFWSRWRKEFLQTLQERHKWLKPMRELEIGDVVIIKDGDSGRNKWPLAKVVERMPSEDGLVRKVKLLVADGALSHNGKRLRPPTYLDRPVQKLVVLLPAGSYKDA